MRYEYNLQQPNFTVQNIGLVNVARQKNYKHSYLNGRTKHGFIYIVKGEMRDTFSRESVGTIHAKAGDLLFIPKGSAYTGTYLEDNTEIKIVQFDLRNGSLPDYLDKPQKLELPNAKDLINAFFEPSHSHAYGHPFYYLYCLYKLLWQIDKYCTKIPAKYKKLQAALNEISTHCERNESVEYYAELCNMSEPNFRKLFREYTGASPITYRNDLRLEHARVLLQSGEYNVSEAAEESGFSNLSFFIRLYKKKYGYTPKKE